MNTFAKDTQSSILKWPNTRIFHVWEIDCTQLLIQSSPRVSQEAVVPVQSAVKFGSNLRIEYHRCCHCQGSVNNCKSAAIFAVSACSKSKHVLVWMYCMCPFLSMILSLRHSTTEWTISLLLFRSKTFCPFGRVWASTRCQVATSHATI